MATYLATPDDYAGWNPTGRNFTLITGGAGAIGLLAWMSLHHHLGAFRPNAASDQLLLGGLEWLGGGMFVLMGVADVGFAEITRHGCGHGGRRCAHGWIAHLLSGVV
jgi:hypothetical protein